MKTLALLFALMVWNGPTFYIFQEEAQEWQAVITTVLNKKPLSLSQSGHESGQGADGEWCRGTA